MEQTFSPLVDSQVGGEGQGFNMSTYKYSPVAILAQATIAIGDVDISFSRPPDPRIFYPEVLVRIFLFA